MGLSALEGLAGLSAIWLVKVVLQRYVALTSVSDNLKWAFRFSFLIDLDAQVFLPFISFPESVPEDPFYGNIPSIF